MRFLRSTGFQPVFADRLRVQPVPLNQNIHEADNKICLNFEHAR